MHHPPLLIFRQERKVDKLTTALYSLSLQYSLRFLSIRPKELVLFEGGRGEEFENKSPCILERVQS